MKEIIEVLTESNVEDNTVRIILFEKCKESGCRQIFDIAEFSPSLIGLNGYIRKIEKGYASNCEIVFDPKINFGRKKKLGSKIWHIMQLEAKTLEKKKEEYARLYS